MQQLAIVEYRNAGYFLYEFSGDSVTIGRIVQFLTENEDFNEDRDSVILVGEPKKVTL